MKLQGRRVLLTGASRGIGAALAEALVREGCDVVGVATRAQGSVLACDVGDPAQVETLRRRIGPVDLLVNNAAVILAPAPLVDIPLAEWERLFRVNVFGIVALCRAFVPDMNARSEGLVVNLSSGWGRIAEGGQAPYCASKFAVEALSRALSEEVARGVVVLAANPGVVATDMLATCFERDVGAYTPPASCASSFVRMLKAAGRSWNGRSVDVTDWD
ncbi:MAG: SDR family NAD(P)-dependent oxidoreductase [Planctomycetaceae bacterium]